jgi:hypothetical protein
VAQPALYVILKSTAGQKTIFVFYAGTVIVLDSATVFVLTSSHCCQESLKILLFAEPIRDARDAEKKS